MTTPVADLAGAIDETDLARWLIQQRWYGAKGAGAAEVSVDEVLPLTGEPPLAVVLVTATAAGGKTGRYQLVVGDAGDGLVHDALTDPVLAPAFVARMASGTSASGVGFSWEPGVERPGPRPSVRPLGVEQSNSSLVIDDRLVLKVFRRLQEGTNLEVEVLAALSRHQFPNVPRHAGSYQVDGTTLGVAQERIVGGVDAWELALDELSGGRGAALHGELAELGRVVARLHNDLGAEHPDPHWGRRPLTGRDVAQLARDLAGEARRRLARLAPTGATAALAGRGDDLAAAALALAEVDDGGQAIRIHGDLHLGQTLLTPDRWVLLDFEGEPARSLAERRSPASPLRDVAGMLRSLSYAAAAAERQRGATVPPEWEAEARAAVLGGYREAVDPALLPADRADTALLLDLFELDKAVYELGYELDNRPDWVPIPVAAIIRILEESSVPAPTAETPTREPRFGPVLGELDLHLMGEGRHEELYRRLGAHPAEHEGEEGTRFAVWAPAARSVAVVGDFNGWRSDADPMAPAGSSGVWERFVPGAGEGHRYKYGITTAAGEVVQKADPLAFEADVPPGTASVINRSRHQWSPADGAWLDRRKAGSSWAEPMSTYEVHLGSWRRDPERPDEPLDYAELAAELADYVTDLGFTHVELLPVMAHPFGGSWGYQVTSYFAPHPTWGGPDQLRQFVDTLHERGIGVILDWVPAHFPADEWALARFDGTALYEHHDPRKGYHPDWGTLIFNYGRHEVRNFLLASALYWLREYHIDGIRVDAVASMLYLDYSRQPGEWVPNEHGGRENLEAVSFLRELNEVIHRDQPGVISAAEESTAWPSVSRPTYLGGLGFGFKWNMGWMHDTLQYFGHDPVHRRYHHHDLTFSLVYAFSENFLLPLSHDEVVHGKGSLLGKMAGDRWQRFANLRCLYALMWAHPGKNLLFMGGELAQEREWDHDRPLDWHLLADPDHAGIQDLVRDLNHQYRHHAALWEVDFEPGGFAWLVADDPDQNVLAFHRRGVDAGGDGGPPLLACVANLAPVVREGYRVPLPAPGRWVEVLNTDASRYGGGDVGNGGAVTAEATPWGDQPASAEITLPPLGVLWLTPERGPEDDPAQPLPGGLGALPPMDQDLPPGPPG